ncbi:MAG TPA: alanine racemase, partial [Rectinemataceae bacterium]|nr:alanine racemase [Rectinemataceae bacterium]
MDERYIVDNAAFLPTPALLFYEEAIRANHELAIRIAGSASRLRPHIKTHKTPEIVKIALGFGISKFKCATIAEAEMLAAAGAKDILVAYQLVGRNAERLMALARRHGDIRFSTLVDAAEPLARLEGLAAQAMVGLGVFLDLDVGQHRTGIAPGRDAEEIYAIFARSGRLRPAGLHCYDGQ